MQDVIFVWIPKVKGENLLTPHEEHEKVKSFKGWKFCSI
jgi:hypothetical protein